jgi:hypothetical protein
VALLNKSNDKLKLVGHLRTARGLFWITVEGAIALRNVIYDNRGDAERGCAEINQVAVMKRYKKVLTLVPNNFNHSSLRKLQKKIEPRRFGFRPVTSEEMCAVNLVTLREGVNHCRWPREVIERFLAVEV